MLGSTIRRCRQRWPFEINAIVLLPDHWHTIWTLPHGDTEYSTRIGWLKKEFTKNWLAIGGVEGGVSDGKRKLRRRGVWQPRFWEHTIETDDEFDRYFDYVHWNPVKHHLVERVRDWPHSSFHRWVARGVYPINWGCESESFEMSQDRLANIDAGEP
jgi:putative transposase